MPDIFPSDWIGTKAHFRSAPGVAWAADHQGLVLVDEINGRTGRLTGLQAVFWEVLCRRNDIESALEIIEASVGLPRVEIIPLLGQMLEELAREGFLIKKVES